MTKKLLETPRHWLTLSACARIFEHFRKKLEFDEPIPPFETRFPGKLEGILNSVRQTYSKEHLNKTILDAAAAYFNHLVRGHALQNGNKRMAVLFTHFFLLKHGIDFTLTPQEMYNFAVIIVLAGDQGISSDQTKGWCKKIIAEFTEEME